MSIDTKRRVQVAKIFMLDSPVIFLDEATTGMDPFMKRRVMDRIRLEARNGRTVLLTTQVLSEAEQLCEQALALVEILEAPAAGGARVRLVYAL